MGERTLQLYLATLVIAVVKKNEGGAQRGGSSNDGDRKRT